jgi:hypothetical protein
VIAIGRVGVIDGRGKRSSRTSRVNGVGKTTLGWSAVLHCTAFGTTRAPLPGNLFPRTAPYTPMRNITDPTAIGSEHAMHLFYLRTSMKIGDHPSSFGTSLMEIETLGFDFAEDLI